jgi:hypothetical protein
MPLMPPQSLINYRDLRTYGIHVSTMIENDEEALVLLCHRNCGS